MLMCAASHGRNIPTQRNTAKSSAFDITVVSNTQAKNTAWNLKNKVQEIVKFTGTHFLSGICLQKLFCNSFFCFI